MSIKSIVAAKYIRFAEEIAEISYAQLETFSSVSSQHTSELYVSIYIKGNYMSKYQNILILSQALLPSNACMSLTVSKPKLTIRTKVVQSIIRSCGVIANCRSLVKNIRYNATEVIKGERTHKLYLL